jgi:hypothetical protein
MRDTVESVLIEALKAVRFLESNGKNDADTAAILDKFRGTCKSAFSHQTVSGGLSSLKTFGITQNPDQIWTLTADWEARKALRDEQLRQEKELRAAILEKLRPMLKDLIERPSVRSADDEITAEAKAQGLKGKKASAYRVSGTRNRSFREWGEKAFFTGEALAIQAGHIIDVELFKGLPRADNTHFNVIPISPNMNMWQLQGLVRMEPTATGLKLVVLCGDPEIKKYDGVERVIDDELVRAQVHERVAVKNEHLAIKAAVRAGLTP